MHVLGLSGLDRTILFRAQQFPELTRQELRITQGMDAAAALVGPAGIMAACAEERFTGVKGTEKFPVHAIHAVLAQAGVPLARVDRIAHGFSYERAGGLFDASPAATAEFETVYARSAQLEVLQAHLGPGDWDARFVSVPHHLAHAASAFFPSGMDDALVLVSDGMGEAESATLWLAEHGRLMPAGQVSHRHSLGVLYGLFTLHLGFRFNSGEYKVMGLAPYGNPKVYFDQVNALVRLQDDGFYNIPVLQLNEGPLAQQSYRGTRQMLAELFGPARSPDAPIEQRHMDLAASLQAVLQNTVLHLLRTHQQRTGARQLCMAGGVALNCTANGVIQRSRLFKRMFVQPASGDDGTALGAALFVQSEHDPQSALRKMVMPLWGTEASDEEIRAALERDGLTVRSFNDTASLTTAAAALLVQEKILGWFQGRMEFGPRALGNRSILADPRSPAMRSRVNALVKKREDFRPFAPAVLAERATTFFDMREQDVETFAHMLCVTGVRPAYRDMLPAITHVDGSARVQTVFAEKTPLFHELLRAFEGVSGLPILLNTSFNVRGQPIVRTAQEAVKTFREAELDALVIGRYLVHGKA